ncbi:MAG TPA: hypothetical protein VI603_13890 [Saprospiraceae bacterium]|nr:hypothetical protein [Saprospiraceae bacterium]
MKVKKIFAPSPFTVLAICLILAAIATWIFPAGKYSTISYDDADDVFMVASYDSTYSLQADDASLKSLGISIVADKFRSGDISRPIAIPGTYQLRSRNPQGLVELAQAPIEGIYEAMDIILLVLIIGGFIGVFKVSGMFEAGVQWLAQKLKGRESLLIVFVTALIAIGGTTFGMAEETLAFYPILVPIFLAAGYDTIIPVAAIYGGSSIGTMFSSVNPFAVIIASDAGGVNWTSGIEMRVVGLLIGTGICIWYILRYAHRVKQDPSRSLLYGKNVHPPAATQSIHAEGDKHVMDARKWLLTTLFVFTFLLMIIGVSGLHWWLLEMTTLFLVSAVIAGFIMWKGERTFIQAFLKGAEEMLGVAIIIGIARGVTILLNNGQISDTMLHSASTLVQGMPGVAFVVVLFFIFMFLTIFISSSSGMAVLTMPIMGPLARVVNVPVEQVVNAYLMGFGVMTFITPTGLILPSLVMVDVSFGTWLKFITPLLLILSVASILFLTAGVMMS